MKATLKAIKTTAVRGRKAVYNKFADYQNSLRNDYCFHISYCERVVNISVCRKMPAPRTSINSSIKKA